MKNNYLVLKCKIAILGSPVMALSEATMLMAERSKEKWIRTVSYESRPQRFVAVRTVNRSKRTVSPHTVIRSEELSSRESGFSFRG